MDRAYLPPAEFLHECFLYNPETGALTWKHRPDHHFTATHAARTWNTKFAGRSAFTTVDKDGYGRAEVRYTGDRLQLRAHRVAYKMIFGSEPEMVDHVDCDQNNNRLKNLRAATREQNTQNNRGWGARNMPKRVRANGKRFIAEGRGHGRNVHLGTFDTPAEAHEAWCAWAKPIHGEFFNPGPDKPSVFD